VSVLSQKIGMPTAATVGLVMTAAETIPLGGMGGQELRDAKSNSAETHETGHMLVSVAGPSAVEMQRVDSAHSFSVKLVAVG
jgi:hypothetical protein